MRPSVREHPPLPSSAVTQLGSGRAKLEKDTASSSMDDEAIWMDICSQLRMAESRCGGKVHASNPSSHGSMAAQGDDSNIGCRPWYFGEIYRGSTGVAELGRDER